MKMKFFFYYSCLACNILLLFERFCITQFIYDLPTNKIRDLSYPIRKTCLGFILRQIYVNGVPT